jgi:hypothetical protein
MEAIFFFILLFKISAYDIPDLALSQADYHFCQKKAASQGRFSCTTFFYCSICLARNPLRFQPVSLPIRPA